MRRAACFSSLVAAVQGFERTLWDGFGECAEGRDDAATTDDVLPVVAFVIASALRQGRVLAPLPWLTLLSNLATESAKKGSLGYILSTLEAGVSLLEHEEARRVRRAADPSYHAFHRTALLTHGLPSQRIKASHGDMQRLAEFLGERDRTEMSGKGLIDWMMEYLPSLARRQDAVELTQCLVWVRGAVGGRRRASLGSIAARPGASLDPHARRGGVRRGRGVLCAQAATRTRWRRLPRPTPSRRLTPPSPHYAVPPSRSRPRCQRVRHGGWLLKQSDVLRAWRPRFFLLLDRTLTYHRQVGDTVRRERRVDGCHARLIRAEAGEDGSCEFHLVWPGGDTVCLRASSEADRDQWLQALSRAMELPPEPSKSIPASDQAVGLRTELERAALRPVRQPGGKGGVA